jgi:hypothetical protein
LFALSSYFRRPLACEQKRTKLKGNHWGQGFRHAA